MKRRFDLERLFDEIIVHELEAHEVAQQLREHAVVPSRPRRPAPERPANWWHGRRKSTRRK